MIVDWDLHHGNGIQDIFYRDRRVLYASLHRYPYYPWTGAVEEVGEGDGKGSNVNIPLEMGCSDADYANIFRHILFPLPGGMNRRSFSWPRGLTYITATP